MKLLEYVNRLSSAHWCYDELATIEGELGYPKHGLNVAIFRRAAGIASQEEIRLLSDAENKLAQWKQQHPEEAKTADTLKSICDYVVDNVVSIGTNELGINLLSTRSAWDEVRRAAIGYEGKKL